MVTPPFDDRTVQRWFAVEFNNQAWELVEKPQRSREETEEMLHLAHASCVHWKAVGTIVNQLRGQCLLATAYVKAGLPEASIRHAERCLTLCEEAGELATPFDRASALGAAANAYACGGDLVRARDHYHQAMEAAEELSDAEEHALIDQLYPSPNG